MKKFIIFVVTALLALAGLTFAYTWDKPLVDQTMTTRGENMKIQTNKEALEEIRSRIDDLARFSGYSSQGQE